MPQHDLLDTVRSFLQSREARGCKENTLYCYRHACRKLIRYFGATAHLASIRADDCAAFKHAGSSTPHETNKEITTARSIWKHAIQRGWAHSNPWLTCDTYPSGGHTRRSLTKQEVAKVFATIRIMEDTGRLLRGKGVGFRLIFYSGARIMEVFRLRWENVDLKHPDGPRFYLPQHKTQRHAGGRVVELHHAAAALLQSLPRTSEWVFPPRGNKGKPSYPWAKWKELCREAGIDLPEGQATHSGRITFATTGLDAGVELGSLMDALGHCDPRSTSRYAKFSHQAARRAVKQVAAHLFNEAAE